MLLSRDDAYGYLNKFLVVEITTTIRNIHVEIPLGKAEGLPTKCVANCDNLRTVSRHAFQKRIARLASKRFPEVKRAVGYAFGWEELIEAD